MLFVVEGCSVTAWGLGGLFVLFCLLLKTPAGQAVRIVMGT